VTNYLSNTFENFIFIKNKLQGVKIIITYLTKAIVRIRTRLYRATVQLKILIVPIVPKTFSTLLFVMLLAVYLLNPLSNTLFLVSSAQESEQTVQTQKRTVPVVAEEDKNQTCLQLGKELFWEQKYSEAIKQLEQCITEDPDNPEIYYYIGQSYFQQGQQSAQKRNIIKATKYYRKAYQVSDTAIEKFIKKIEENSDKDHTNDYLQLAYIHEIRSLIPGVDEYQKAIDIYQKLIAEKPYHTNVYYHLGWIYYQQEDYQNSIDAFLKYLKPGVKSDFVYYYLGLSYDKIDEKEQAEYYFRLILKEFPDTNFADLAKKELF
jgi:tetratricopeptide (TPR) repeat protein